VSTILFLLTFLALIVLLGRALVRAVRRKPVTPTLRLTGIVIAAYALLWGVFSMISSDRTVPLGSDVCFDDWCASVTGAENPALLGDGSGGVRPNGQFVVLHVRMSNHARGIAQKPSEPRIHIIDSQGRSWSASEAGQHLLELTRGLQSALDARLELHQSIETQIAFDIPAGATGLKALIEEGPPITLLLLPEDREVFPI
jgi:hypothetical protein